MRALLALPIQNQLSIQQLRELLRPTGWLITETTASDWDSKMTAQLTSKFAVEVQEKLKLTDKVLIDVGNNEYGLASLEQDGAIRVRVVKDNASQSHMKTMIDRVTRGLLPLMVELTPPGQRAVNLIQILEHQGTHPIHEGQLSIARGLTFRQFLSRERRVEAGLLLVTSGIFALTFIAAIVLAAVQANSGWPLEVRGWTERISSSFLVAALTSVVTLTIQFRRWQADYELIEWA